MASIRGDRVVSTSFVALFVVALIAGGCAIVRTAPSGPLPSVSPLPSPQTMALVGRYSPRGKVDTLAQVRIAFKQPLIPLESLESPDEQRQLDYFTIEPALAGRFRFLTPSLVGFQADAALPIATRIRVTIRDGLSDVRGDKLTKDFSWTFNTTPLEIDTYVTADTPVSLTPALSFESNAQLDETSIARGVTIVAADAPGVPVPIAVTLQKSQIPDSDDAQTKFDPSLRDWYYTVTPTRPLTKATSYELKIEGLLPSGGNLPLEHPVDANFETFGPLRLVGVDRFGPPDNDDPRFAGGDPRLEFDNGVTVDSATAAISISPTPKPWASLVQMYDTSQYVDLEPAAFDPAKEYTITIGPGLTDTFGQMLGKTLTVRFNPGEVAPNFWAPSGLSIFPSGIDLRLVFSAINLPDQAYSAAYRVLQPGDLASIDPTDLYGYSDRVTALPGVSAWTRYPAEARKNQPADVTVQVQDKLGGPTGLLLYGAFGNDGSGAQPFTGAVQLTNLGVFEQWFPASGIVRVHHLLDGSPVSGSRVDVYRSTLDGYPHPRATPCATGSTDGTGTASFDALGLSGCMDGQRTFTAGPELVTVAHEGADWSYARTYEWSGSWDYGIYSGWDDGTPQSRGTIYSDRSLYQQGEDAWFTGAAYYLQNGALHRDADAKYRLTLEDPNGNKSDLGYVTTDDVGSFSRKVTFSSDQALGYYLVHARSSAGVQIDGQFRVAQFKPPNFKVTLDLDKLFATAGSTVHAKVSSAYLFGAPVQGGKTTVYVTRQQTQFTPKGWDDYTFGRQWTWPETPPSVDTDVLQTTATVGADGEASAGIDVAGDLPYAMAYEVDAETTDVSNLSVTDTKTFTALPSGDLIGIQGVWVAMSGKTLPVKIVVVDPSGTALGGRKVHVELQRVSFDNVAQIVEGGDTTLNQLEYKNVDTADVTSGGDAVVAPLTPPAAGFYRIRANFGGAQTDATATDSFVWCTGDNPVYWGSQNPDQLEIKMDRAAYEPGDTATVLIQSPYTDAELYFAVIRHDTIYHVIRKVHGGAPEISFRVTPDMLPNAAVEAVLVRTGQPLSKTRPGDVDSLDRVGFAPFDVKVDAKYLNVAVSPRAASVAPGGRQTVTFAVTDGSGKPARGEIAVAVANDAVLQLSGYRFPDLVSTVYADQDITTRFADNRPNAVLSQPPSPIDKGWGFGGGFSAAAADTRIRTNFQPLAYFDGAVRIDANGRAQVTFDVPDDLTTWRVMAVASGAWSGIPGDFRFGTGDATFITTKPLVTNPLLPQFARPGDEFVAGVSVTNVAALHGPVAIRGQTTGSISFDEKGTPSSTDSAAGSIGQATQAYLFPVVAGSPGDGRLRFETKTASASDAFEVPLPVIEQTYLEQVVESGVTSDSASIPLDVSPGVDRGAGGLRLSIASTLLPEIVEPARNVLDDDCLPFAEPAASQLAVAADAMILSRKYGRVSAAFSPAQVAAQDLAYLRKLQLADGGFADWPGLTKADPTTSAYVAQSIGAAIDAGIAVDPAIAASLRSYLKSVLANPSDFDCASGECWNRLRFASLEGLSALHETRTDFLSDIDLGHDSFDLTTRIQLARYLLRLPSWRADGRALAQKLSEDVYETGRTATINSPQRWLWDDSIVTEQSQMLGLMIDDGADPSFIDRMVQGLLALRRQGTWAYPYEDAQALGALIDYGAASGPPPNFSATAQLGDRTIGSADFSGYAQPERSFDVPMADLTTGKSDLSLRKSGTGALHYFVSYDYALRGSQPGAIQGLRVLRIVRRANDPAVIWQSGLMAPTQSLSLTTGQVFDIELEIIVDHPVDHVVVTDPLPAGFEAIDASFLTSTQYFQAMTDSWQLDYQAIYRDRVVAYGDHLDAGDYSFHYLVRSVTAGTFTWPGADAHLQYAPETFGRTASCTLELTD
jgi:uncharacterized protein YfaS (alpha-2-macroglobulin family)